MSFRPEMALFHNSPPGSGQVGVNRGIACAAYKSMPPRNAADFLELAENCTFLDRKLIIVINEYPDGHQLAGWAR